MDELPSRRAALATVVRAGDFGAIPPAGPGVILAACFGRAILQIAAPPADYAAAAVRLAAGLGVMLPSEPSGVSAGGGLTALWTGPGRVWVVGPDGRDLEREIGGELAGLEVALVSLGHSRSIIRARGPRVRDLLSAECSLDFDPATFPPRRAMQSSYGRINLLIHAVDDEPTFELYVYRGFAVSLWEQLVEGALEFGCRVPDAGGLTP